MLTAFIRLVSAKPGLGGFLEWGVLQGLVHRQRYSERKGKNIAAADHRLHRRRDVRYLIYIVHRSVIVWYPNYRGYSGLQEGLHELVNGSRYYEGNNTSKRFLQEGNGWWLLSVGCQLSSNN